MEYPEAYATDLHASRPRRSSGERDKPQLLRRRTASRIDSSAHLNQEHLSDEFRGVTPVLKSFSYDIIGANDRCKLGDYARPELSDFRRLTPESDDSYHPTISVRTATMVAPCGAHISRAETKLGPTDKFTHTLLKPSPLEAPDIGGISDDLDGTEPDLQESIGAVLLESGIGSPGVFGVERSNQWARFKWGLFCSVFLVFVHGLIGLDYAIKSWFGIWKQGDIMFVADPDILILVTLAASILVLAALTGFTGALLSSRPVLAFYTRLLWLSFIVVCATGYAAYKRSAFAFEQKLKKSWTQLYTPLDCLVIQNTLQCCGWSSPWDEGVPSGTCYPRTLLQGCKASLIIAEQMGLRTVWETALWLGPTYIIHIYIVMICASYIPRTFGAGVALTGRSSLANDLKHLIDRRRAGISSVRRQGIARASTNTAFGEAREETVGLLEAYSDEVKEQ